MKPDAEPVKDYKINGKTNVNDLMAQFKAAGGFTAKKLAVGIDIVERMIKDKDCLRFFSFPACINATGTRGVIKDMIRKKWFDVVIGTCGTLDHDIARVYTDYYHGDFMMDDAELRERGINRLGNVLVPNESYGVVLEDKFKKFLEKIYEGFTDEQKKKGITTHEFVWNLGELIDADPDAAAKKEESIVYWCWKNKIPMIVPGPTDGSVGYQIWQFAQDHDFRLHLLGDEQLLSDKTWQAKKSGALIIGGGISKHHVIWWNQFKQGGLDYAVYVSTAVEWDGSLSGARPREAVSWGKIGKEAKFVNIEEDATIALPIIYAALNERM
jgi:deoxyhypusine synthase